MSKEIKFEKLPTKKEIRRHINPSIGQEILDYFLYFLRVFLIVSIVYFITRNTILDTIEVSGKSMYPTFDNKDQILLNRLSSYFSSYKRGDVVIVNYPEKCDASAQTKGVARLFIKRVIGLPGEKVILENGKIYIQNTEYPEGIELKEKDYLEDTVKSYKGINEGSFRFEEKVLDKDEYYVVGDNRTNSTDSRVCGPIKKNMIHGKELFRLTPESKKGFFVLPTYNISHQNV
jgi:signal peptidase I